MINKKYFDFLELEESVYILTKQLKEENYESTFVYFNNVKHLLKKYQQIEFYILDEDFKKFIVKKNEKSLHGINTAGQVILALLNFIKVAQKENLKTPPENCNEDSKHNRSY